jgi:putative ABC transport system permease protein
MTPLLRHAPFTLWRQPTVFGAIAVGAMLVGLAAASSPLFTAAAGSAALRTKLEEITSYAAGAEIRRGDYLTKRPLPDDSGFRSAVAAMPFVGDAVVTTVTDPLTAQRAGTAAADPASVRLMSRTGVLEHVDKVAGRDGDGLWIADSVARTLGIGPGDSLVLTQEGFDETPRTVEVPVDGVYRALEGEAQTGYWVNFTADIYKKNPDDPPPPSFAFGDPEQVLALERALGGGPVESRWEFPLQSSGISLDEAKALDRRFTALEDQLHGGRSAVWREIGCAATETTSPSQCSFRSSLSAAITLADRNIDAVSPPARLLASAGMLIALAVVGAAGAFLVSRRRVEVRLLFAQGRAAIWFAGRTAGEALLPVLLGGAVGAGLAFLLVKLFESGGSIDRQGLEAAAATAGAGIAAALMLLAVVVGAAFLRQFESGLPGRVPLAWLPWELIPLGLAAYLFLDLRSGNGLVGGGSSGIAHPSLAVFLLPLLVTAGVAGLAGRLMRGALHALGGRTSTFPAPVYVALRRLAGSGGLAVVLLCSCAVALAALFYAQTLVATLERMLDVKAHVAKGGDVEGIIDYTDSLPEGFAFPLTKVTIGNAGAAVGGPTGPQVDLMAIDPETFAGVASWEPSWGPPLEDIMRRLAGYSGPDLPVVVAGGTIAARQLYAGGALLSVQPVALVEAFPGMSAGRPLVVTSYAAIERAARRAGIGNPLHQPSAMTLVWGKGPPGELATALSGSALGPYYVQSTETFLADPDVAAETRTFSFLRALGIVAGILAVAASVLYLQARQRRTVVAAALSRRMGLGHGSQALALSLELGAIFLVAVLVAGVTSLTTARFVAAKIDPLAIFPPAPLVEVPFHVAWIAIPALLVVAGLGGALAARRAARADFAEVMRLGE